MLVSVNVNNVKCWYLAVNRCFYLNVFVYFIYILLNCLQPTLRAKLGMKALKNLKKGKPVDDQVMVDILVEAIR